MENIKNIFESITYYCVFYFGNRKIGHEEKSSNLIINRSNCFSARPYLILLIIINYYLLSIAASEDTLNPLLTAYRLSPEQEVQFSVNAQQSAFWDLWNQKNINGTVSLDFAHLTPLRNSWSVNGTTFAGDTNPQLIIRVAWGAKGLYLFFDIRDDSLMIQNFDSSDAIQLFLDRWPSEQIMNGAGGFDEYVGPSHGWIVTWGSIQYLTPVGLYGIEDSISIGLPASDSTWSETKVSLAHLPLTWQGLEIDNFSIPKPSHRGQEWFIPWSMVGGPRGPDTVSMGRYIATSIVYDDHDAGDPAMRFSTALSWKEKDPFHTCTDLNPPHMYCDAWGDIILGPSLDGVASINRGIRNYSNATAIKSKEQRYNVEFYDLHGARIGTSSGLGNFDQHKHGAYMSRCNNYGTLSKTMLIGKY